MQTDTRHDPIDLDDAPVQDDPVVVVLALALGVVFAGLLALAMVWVR